MYGIMTPRDGLINDTAASSPDGHLPRRKVSRRLALLGTTAAASSWLLSACGGGPGGSSRPAPADVPPPGRVPGTPGGSEITFAGPSGQLRGSWAEPAGTPKATVLVVHDNQGLTDHFSDLVGRFAGAGYGTLCADLLSGHGGGPTDPAQAPAALANTPSAALLAELRAGITELTRRVPGTKIGAVGFGFGGGLLWQLLAAGEPNLAAATVFYGLAPQNADYSQSHAAVLGIYAEHDKQLTESQDKTDQALLNANLVHNSIVLDNTDVGFFDDTGPRYNPGAAAQAWLATLDWFKQYL